MALHSEMLNKMELIKALREMEVCLEETHYNDEIGFPFPKRPFGLQTMLSLYKLNLPIVNAVSKRFVRSKFRKFKPVIYPGFECLYGNINCDSGVSLHNTKFIDYANVYIGANSRFSFDNIVITSDHFTNDIKKVRAREIVIGENVWITSRVVILGGIRIGRNSIIGAGSVVTSDIPPNVFAAGVPARPLKQLE